MTGIKATPYEEVDVGLAIHERVVLKRRTSKNPGINRDITLTSWKVDGEETNKIFIADAWPSNWAAVEANQRERRVEQGQGPRGADIFQPIHIKGEDGEEDQVTFVRTTTMSPTRKRWSRTDRRIKAAIGRAVRRRQRMAERKRFKKLRALHPSKGPTPPNPDNKKQEEAAAA